MSNEANLKGTIHVVLAMLGIAELLTASTKTRKFFLGTATGWHLHCALYHFVYEKQE